MQMLGLVGTLYGTDSVLASFCLRYGPCGEPPRPALHELLLVKPYIFVETHESKHEHEQCRRILTGNIYTLSTALLKHLWRDHVKFQAFLTSSLGTWPLLHSGIDYQNVCGPRGPSLTWQSTPLAAYSQLWSVIYRPSVTKYVNVRVSNQPFASFPAGQSVLNLTAKLFCI